MSERVGGTDSLFLSMETRDVHGHIGGLAILDPTEAPDFSFAAFRDHVASRVDGLPRFRSVLRESPLGLTRPWWVDDESFDIRRHVRRIALPAGGDRAELLELVAWLHSQKLNHRRPLWEMWLIEGLEEGRVAFYSKTHHSLMDGTGGSDLATALMDVEPNPSPRPVEARIHRQVPEEHPSLLEMLTEDFLTVAATPMRLAGYSVSAVRRGLEAAPFFFGDHPTPLATGTPTTAFNGSVGPARAFASVSLPLADLREVKDRLGVKLNDVVLELAGTAVRRHLEETGEVVDGPLTASCPVSTRVEGDADGGNRVASMIVSCGDADLDPVDRVHQIHAGATRAKEMLERVRSVPIPSLGEVAPPWLVRMGSELVNALADRITVGNFVVSNVPGPPIPLFAAGARVEAVYPMSLLLGTQGLNITAVSFLDRMDFGILVDPDRVPNPQVIADAIPQALQSLKKSTPTTPRLAA